MTSLVAMYKAALARIEKRERAALAQAVLTQGGWKLPAPYRRQEIRRFYSKLKDGLYADYQRCMAMAPASGVASPDGSGSGAG